MARVQGIIAQGLSAGGDRGKQQRESSLAKAEQQARAAQERGAELEQIQASGEPSDFFTSSAAGLGIGMVLGGVPGLIAAGITHVFNKKRRAGIAAYAMAEAGTTEETLARGRGILASAKENATSPEQLAEIELQEAEFEQYAAGTTHPDANVRTQSLISALGVSGTLDTELEQFQDRQNIEQDRLIAEDTRQFNKWDNLNGDLQRESARFTAANETWQKAKLAYERPNSQSDVALIYLTAQMIDPGAIVTDGDSKMIQATGNLTQQMAGYLNSMIEGTALFDDQVRDGLMSTIAENYMVSRKQQMDVNTKYQEIGTQGDAPLTGDYLKNLQVKIDPTDGQEIAKFRQFNPAQAMKREGLNQENMVADQPGQLATVISNATEWVSDVAGDVSQQLRDVQRYTDKSNGDILEVGADGIVKKVGTDPDFLALKRYQGAGKIYPINRGSEPLETN